MNGTVVIDASVILKWVLPPEQEPHHAQGQALGEAMLNRRLSVAVPPLWYYEVGNILIRRYPEHAAQDLSDLRKQLALFEQAMTPAWQSRILDLAARYRVTFYDAAYHALAIVREGVFVTADEKYLQAVTGEPHVMHLKDWA